MPFSYLCLSLMIMLAKTSFSEVRENEMLRPSENLWSYVPGRLLVKLGHRMSPETLAEIEKNIGAKKIYSFSLVEGLHLYQLDEHASVEEARQDFLNTGAVIYAEPDYLYRTQLIEDAEYPRQYALENTGQNAGVPDADINASMMWSLEMGKKNVVVGIIDTGVDYTHPDLVANVWHNSEEIPGNNKDDDQNGYIDDIHGINAITNAGNPMDDNKHGTHVGGTIAASANTIGVRGVAPGAQIAACKFLGASGSGAVSDAIKCMQYFAQLKMRAKNPVNIVATNNSWGGGAASDSMLDAIKAHESLGILFIAAAGNLSENNDVVDRYPCGYKVPNIIAVAATDNKDQLAVFSSYGKKTVHVGAPGVKILSTVLRHEYGELSGTSMATPHVSGLAAILASHYPDYSSARIKNLIMAGGQTTPGTLHNTISGRRIRGADTNGSGSLTCKNQLLGTRLSPAGASHRMPLGTDVLLSSTGINCALSADMVTLLESSGLTISLNDNGTNGDAKANDGVYSLRWVPSAVGEYSLDFGQGDVLNIWVFDGGRRSYEADTNVDFSYELIRGQKLNANDETMHLFRSPFAIPFGGIKDNFFDLYISSNGTISFTDRRAPGYRNTPLPKAGLATLVAPYWDDLAPDKTESDIFVKDVGQAPNRKLVVEWWNVRNFRSSGTGAFQVVFYENSPEIRFNYLDTDFNEPNFNFGRTATVGLQTSHDEYSQFSFNEAKISSPSSILFRFQ